MIRLAEGRGTDGPAPFVSVTEDICATARLRCFDRTESRCKGMVSIKNDAEASGELIRLLLPAREIPGTVSRLSALALVYKVLTTLFLISPIGKMERPRCPRINEYSEPFVNGTVRTPSTVDIASKSHTRNHERFRSNLTHPSKSWGSGRTPLPVTSTSPRTGVISTLGLD